MIGYRKLFGAWVLLAAAPVFGDSPVRKLLQENRLEEATAICRQYEVLSSTDADNFLACAWVYFHGERLDSAEQLMNRLRKGAPSAEYQLLSVYDQMKRKQFDLARKAINSLAQEYRSGPVAISIQELSAELYEATKEPDTAAFLYKQVVSEDNSRGRAHWGLGRYYLAHGDLGRAKTHLEQAAHLWPKHLGSRYDLAVISLQTDNLPDAWKWLAECYKLDKADPGVLEQLGLYFEKKGMITQAIKFWQRAVELADKTQDKAPVAKEKLALYVTQVIDALIEGKQFKQALAQIEAFGKDLKDPKLLVRRGQIYRNLGKYEKAVRDLLAYSAINSKDPLAWRELGICYVNLKLWEQAGGSFVKASELEPKNGLNFAWMAFVLEQKGRLKDARSAWQQASELLSDPDELKRANKRMAALDRKLGRAPAQSRSAERESEGDAPESETRLAAPSPKRSDDGPQVPRD